MKKEFLQWGACEEAVSLKKYNTFKIGGIAKYMVHPDSVEHLCELIQFLKEKNIRYFLLGNGSNVIMSDEEFDGVIIHLDMFDKLIIQDTQVIVGAGVMMPKLSYETIKSGLTGFEWAIGIPGTLGGCIYGNAEAYKISTFDSLVSLIALTPDGDVKCFLRSDLTHGYRTSFFKENPGYIILEAVFSLERGDMSETLEKVNHRKIKRLETQPLEYPSAGSVFRNPSPENPSGKLIEDAGLKGITVGGAQVSNKHANFIINTGNATSNDVKNLIELVHQKVFETYQIDLKMEQEYVGWN